MSSFSIPSNIATAQKAMTALTDGEHFLVVLPRVEEPASRAVWVDEDMTALMCSCAGETAEKGTEATAEFRFALAQLRAVELQNESEDTGSDAETTILLHFEGTNGEKSQVTLTSNDATMAMTWFKNMQTIAFTAMVGGNIQCLSPNAKKSKLKIPTTPGTSGSPTNVTPGTVENTPTAKKTKPAAARDDGENEKIDLGTLNETRKIQFERMKRRVQRRKEAKVETGTLPPEAALLARRGDYNALLKLLDGGVNVNARDTSQFGHNRTMLHKAAAHGRVDVTRMLLSRGADPDAFDAQRRTPLSWAARHGHSAIVQLLLDFGCEFYMVDARGKRPLDLAIEEDNMESKAILERMTVSHSRRICMRVLAALSSDKVQSCMWKWRVWAAEAADNEYAIQVLQEVRHHSRMQQSLDLQQSEVLKRMSAVHEQELAELRKQRDAAIGKVRRLSQLGNKQLAEDDSGGKQGMDLAQAKAGIASKENVNIAIANS